MGDSSVLIAIVLVAALYFFICRDYSEALAILAALALSASLITLLKLGFLSCGNNYFHIKSPSGHSALSVAVYGTYPLLLIPRMGRKAGIFFAALFYGLAFFITVTRVTLHTHSLNEAVLGLVVGIITILIVKFTVLGKGKRSLGNAAPRFNIYILMGLSIGVLLYLHGTRLPAEKTIGEIAGWIKDHLPFCG